MDHYKVLELEVNCSPEDIKAAFRRIAKEIHPDNFIHKPAEAIHASHNFTVLKEAYRTLKDPVLRKSYDQKVLGIKAESIPSENHSKEDIILQIDPVVFTKLFMLIVLTTVSLVGYSSYLYLMMSSNQQLNIWFWLNTSLLLILAIRVLNITPRLEILLLNPFRDLTESKLSTANRD